MEEFVVSVIAVALGCCLMLITWFLLAAWRERWRAREIENLRPGMCQCGHQRCSHVEGRRECKVQFTPAENGGLGWTRCACQTYIRDRDDNGGEPSGDPTPSPQELEKMLGY